MSDGTVRCDKVIPTLAVGDVAAASEWYVRVLGCQEGWRWGDPPAHAGMHLDQAEFHLSRMAPDPGAGWLYFVVDDVDALYDRVVAAGVTPAHPPEDQEWGMRETALEDLVGNGLTLAQPIMPRTPALPVRRREVTVRLEERLADVLGDLAEIKGMTVGEALEETLLHTFEPLGDGVAHPHTRAQSARIQELKREHGIDYDVHASYRFVEEDAEGGGG